MGDNNPVISAVLSFFIPGLGQALICKKAKKGVLIFVLAVAIGLVSSILALFTLGLTMLLPFLWWVANIYDAYSDAKGKPVIPL